MTTPRNPNHHPSPCRLATCKEALKTAQLTTRRNQRCDGMNRGAHSSASREETGRLEPDSRTRYSRNCLGEADACPAVILRRRDGRMRWSDDDNIALMRMHYIAMNPVNRSDKRYRELITEYWSGAHPDREVKTATLANRVRWITQY
ncbi:hypothetical protein HHI36_016768 [Cryptolaemus montrouzieri]|uniref:Uncharacterized protein n=1 Tax=Cryptolaemus montrouzieri TaxID=559131 RepID=A0ABD2NKR3_9CUCU